MDSTTISDGVDFHFGFGGGGDGGGGVGVGWCSNNAHDSNEIKHE